MLSTELSTFLLLLAACIAVFVAGYAAFIALRAQKYAGDCAIYVNSENKRAVSLRRMAEVEAALTELSDSYDALLRSHKKLRARIGMRANRQKEPERDLLDTVPKTDAEKAAYKNQLRLQARKNGILKG